MRITSLAGRHGRIAVQELIKKVYLIFNSICVATIRFIKMEIFEIIILLFHLMQMYCAAQWFIKTILKNYLRDAMRY